MMDAHDDDDGRIVDSGSRRRFLATTGAAAAASLAGCGGFLTGSSDDASGSVSLSDFRGSGPMVEQRGEPDGTSISELPDLSGELTVYLGGGEGGLYLDLIELLETEYADFDVNHQRDSSSDLANKIIEESRAGAVQADAFLAVDAGSLGAVAEEDAAASLGEDVLEPVPDAFRDGQGRWVGFAGRARAVPYNTNELSESDVPSTVHDFPDTIAGSMGWGPSYGAFQSFVTAMRLDRGDDATRDWLNAMLEAGVSQYGNEWEVSNAVANGELQAGFANHYYTLRVKRSRPDAPIGLAFTEGDAGALVNVSGAQLLQGSENVDLAENFFRHLLSAEAQEFFATRTFAYPMIPGVEPVGGLPTIDELNPPDIDLTELADVSGTVDMLRDVGAL
nr:extracellular solute-binding protein [Halomicrobium salinisoli]